MKEQTPLDQLIGNYRILAPIASGAFATVYQAQHQILQERIVAIKILHMHLNSEQQQQQFLREAHVLEQLRHPHILPLLDVGVTAHFPYLVTAYAKLGSLRTLLKPQSGQLWAWETALSILAQVAAALSYAHQQRVIHRDLKPENILFLSPQEAVLADFGIATVFSTSSMTSTTITGTPSYMAPEQFRGQVSPESDQYALGCLVYELVTGRPPFSAPDAIALGFKHTTEPPLPPRQLNQQIAPYVEQAILKALAKERHERHSNVTAFITALYPPTVYQATSGITSPDAVLPTSHAPSTQTNQQAAQQWREKGDTLLNQHRYEEAIVAYDQAIRLDPSNAAIYCNKGNALYGLKCYQEAIAAYDQALRLDPNDVLAYRNKGTALKQLGRYKEALVAYDQAIYFDPNNAVAHFNKGGALEQLGRYNEALAAYERALYFDPDDDDASKGMQRVLSALQTLAMSQQASLPPTVPAFHQPQTHDGTIDKARAKQWADQGWNLANHQRYEEGLEAFEHALQCDPSEISTLTGKANCLFYLRRYQEALIEFERAVPLAPNNQISGIICSMKGNTLIMLGRIEEALATLEKALQSDPTNVNSLGYKAQVLLNLGRTEEALEVYELILRLDPHNQMALEGKQNMLTQYSSASDPATTQAQQKTAKQWREEAAPFMVQKRSEYERAEQTSQQTEIEQAEHLLLSGQERAAGSLAGVALEMHLRKRCEMHALAYSPKATLQTLIQLLQEADAITPAEAKHLTGLASIRNKCAHASPVSKDEVRFLVKEVKKFIGAALEQAILPTPEVRYSPKMVKEDAIVLPPTPKFFLPLKNSDGLLTQRQFEEWRQRNLQDLSGYLSAGSSLQFNGLYRTIGEDSNHYLRFYPDGTVLGVSISEPSTAEQVAPLFGKGGYKGEQGRYKQLGTQIGFTLRDRAVIDYAGIIVNDHVIFLESYSQTTQYRLFQQYNYHQTALLA